MIYIWFSLPSLFPLGPVIPSGPFPAVPLRTGITSLAPTADDNQDNVNQSDNTV